MGIMKLIRTAKVKTNVYDFFWNHRYYKVFIIFGFIVWSSRIEVGEFRVMGIERLDDIETKTTPVRIY